MPSTSPAYAVQPTILRNGSAIPPDLLADLLDLRVEQSIQLPDVATLRFSDPDFAHVNSPAFAIGDEIEIKIKSADSEESSLTVGELTALGVEPGPSGMHELAVTALDKGHRLAGSVKVRTFTDVTDVDIVGTIAGEHGLSSDADSTSTTHAYMLQHESDYAFLSRRALALGYRWWVEGSTLKFKKIAPGDSSGITVTWGTDLVSFKARMSSAEAAPTVTVRAWNPDQQTAIVGSAAPVATTSNGLAADATAATGVAAHAKEMGADVRFVSTTLPDASSANDLAASLGKYVVSAQATAKGVILGDSALRPGKTIALEGVGSQLEGTYTVTRTEHVLGANAGYTTRFVCDGVRPAEMVDLLRPPDPAAAGDLHGLLIGTVTNINDNEQPARVKVKFPTLSDEDESAWARVLALGAGAGRGLQVLPEVNDEVLVGFEQGDPSRPVVLGGLWSKKNAPPIANDQAVANDLVKTRVLKTRVGHTVKITDASSPADSNIVISLGDSKGEISVTQDLVSVTTAKNIKLDAGGKIDLKAGGDVTIKGANVKIDASSNADIQGTQVTAKGKSKATIDGAQTEVKASATLKLQGGAMTEVKGGMVKLN